MYVCIYTTYTIHGSHHVTFSHSRVPTSPCYSGGGGDISCCSASLPVSTTEPQESSEAEPNSSPRAAAVEVGKKRTATGGKYGKDGISMDLG